MQVAGMNNGSPQCKGRGGEDGMKATSQVVEELKVLLRICKKLVLEFDANMLVESVITSRVHNSSDTFYGVDLGVGALLEFAIVLMAKCKNMCIRINDHIALNHDLHNKVVIEVGSLV